MKPYEELTRLGRIRRLRRVAIKALQAYDLEIASVRFFTIETNTMFEVCTASGERMMLRIYSDEETTLVENQAEMFWLDALIRDTDLKVTAPIPRRDGDYISVVTVPGVPADRRCVLFSWIPGRPLADHLSVDSYTKFGQTLARLHAHATTLNPLPSDIHPKMWDKVFYYPDEPVVYNTPDYSHLFPPERVVLLDKVIEKADAVFAQLFSDADNLILIHGDLHYWNAHYHRGEIYVLDFEDINRGYPVQDVAVTLYYGRPRDDYDALRAAFKQGYCSVRPWPVEDESVIQTLMAVRSVMFINYVARINPQPQDYIEERCQELVQFLTEYA